jgi:hypothetical protein
MQKSKIYYLSSSENPDYIRYVGKTDKKLEKRLWGHITRAKSNQRTKSRKSYWILNELKKGNEIQIHLLDEVPKEEWKFWEIYWISQIKSWDFKLTNTTNGGDGELSPEQIEKMKGSGNHFYGKKHTEESLILIKMNHPLRKSINQLDLEGNLIKIWNSSHEIQKETGFHRAHIVSCCKKKKHFYTAYGYKWDFAD